MSEPKPCLAVRQDGTQCPERAHYRSVVPPCLRHLKAIGAWYHTEIFEYGSIVDFLWLRSERICEAPAGLCDQPVSKAHPQFRMCQQHLAPIWQALQGDEERRLAGERAKQELSAARFNAIVERVRREQAAARAADPGTIYYLRIGSEYKIGWTKNLYRRLGQYPPTAEVLATEPGTRDDEKALHRRFAKHRVAGREWYRRSGAISRHIKAVAEVHGSHDPRDPIRLHPRTPQERQAESLRYWGRGGQRNTA